MTIKDNIKEEILKRIETERKNLERRIEVNEVMKLDCFDANAEMKFLDELEKFVNSI